ncbi:MAG: bifunctional 4-hydroxy-2-oxoglutarate aldolase/2-dehydro-3-deoxy-phosphogluconate aldolase [Burkholderiaceae bacterium]|nr:bifunctional 4-hydroxy-2-oxoglutarate aldolase/2-dehydro-3-deoxy-phosphogluconate aldolase [Aquabacterium sp.]NUP85533.1 bifunctional 4-hydroxy-2-oxoglutarate aldolase/2-dehydro-3-deoxy-phosphogluconate aldolase [Burkholderiaceae bacterium]
MIEIDELLAHGPVIPVIVVHRVADAVPLAEALVAGGVRVLEVTLRTEAALPAIEAIARSVPQAVVGAGTVRKAADVTSAAAAGCRFAVSPGYTRELGAACRAAAMPLLPGVATATEVMQASADGYRLLKFFPAEQAGGVAMLKALGGPFADVRFCPTGGISVQSAPQYLALAHVPVCGGSWLTPVDALDASDWSRVTALARQAQALPRAWRPLGR